MIDALVLAVLVIVLVTAYVLQRRSRREIASLQLEQAQLQRERDVESLRAAQAEAKLDALGLAVLEVIVIVDRDLRVMYATPGARALFETGTEAIERSLIEFSRSAELDQLAADALASSPAASGTRDELDRIIPISGRPFRVRATAFEGGAVLALSDVSELQRLGRARRDFVANISHELRTPLTSIRLVLENLLDAAPRDPQETAGQLRKIQVEVEALQQMAQELLDLAQIESGRTPVRLVPTDIERLVGDTVARFAAQAARKRETLTAEVAPGLTVLADAELVRRALGNLLHNAIKFTPPEGHVWVRAGRLGGDVVIEVADDGPGIPRDDLPRVFERFFRADRSRAGGGTGLGLAIARHVVEAHGGRIWAESDGIPGHGVTVRLTLPAADSPE
ncbi:MAG TPA: ATP-binding protein [Anaerolineae bacterium]|nr:ATP-binding protein [Anaerolineae bacterium]